jgi:light-regulated signal transduction histidine kinase (bacteriophytochrome)
MRRLIDELLAFSRTGKADLNARPVDLGALVGEVIETLRPAVNGRPVDWRIGELPEVRADPVLLRAVVQNLLDNALKFTRGRAPAQIEVGADASNGRRAIWVRDNGVGFDPRHAGKIFGIFQRLHRGEEFEGHGVGLANVQRIIHRHGGTVWAEAEPGTGATFTFTLPAA